MNDMRQMTALGRSIEDGSFAIIEAEAGPHEFGPAEWQVVRRVIHATADFEFKTLMRFHPDAVSAGIRALLEQQPDMEVVAEASNGREALQLIRQYQPNIVLMDIAMPVMTGSTFPASRSSQRNFPANVLPIMLS